MVVKEIGKIFGIDTECGKKQRLKKGEEVAGRRNSGREER